MMKTTVTAPTTGSTTNCLTRTNAPTSTAFTAGASTAPIIEPFGTFMTRPTDIDQPRDTTIIQGPVIMATATGVTDSISTGVVAAPPVEGVLQSDAMI